MPHNRIEIRTADGSCPAYVFRPSGAGPWPGVLFFMDGIAIRPALFEMGEKMAQLGYYVLLPDLYYRAGPYPPMDAKTVFTDPAQRQVLMTKFISTASVANVMKDASAFLDHFANNKDVKPGKIGVTGYCLGGRLALCAAGTYPERFASAASFHGGNIANDAPDSPHLLASKMKAEIYIAQAENDPADQTAKMEKALADAGVKHKVETYPAKHGWVPSDTPAHDPAQAQRHWKELAELFGKTLS